MYRTLVILRHTFREAVAQPIYSLLVAFAAAILIIFALLPFFTLGEDTVMFKSVGLDVILLFVLLSTLFATSKSVYEEIEDRTMLTLMSKPVRKWEVLLGKYLGIVTAAAVAVAVLGAILLLGVWLRVPGDYLLSTYAIDDRVVRQIHDLRWMHVAGLLPNLVLVWLQVAVLAAVGVALSVRFSLVVNLPTVILLYIAGNLTRFLPLDHSWTLKNIVSQAAAFVLPYLQTFDLRQATLFREIAVPQTEFADPVKHKFAVHLGTIAGYLATATAYAVGYAAFALGAGLLMFQNRELGGAEG
jgi:ABC-type transport system involved in multi-copper enzyme maturation permease subunit